jgi:hypothetical protein
MDAKTPITETVVSLDVCSFPPHRAWMRMTWGQLRRSLFWLHEDIRLDVMRTQEDWPALEFEDEMVHIPKFCGARDLMWCHRCSGIVGRNVLLVEYEICEIGKPQQVIVEGELKFRRCA